MHSKVTAPTAALAALASELLSVSAQFEPSRVPRGKTLEGLSLFSALEAITRGSLAMAAPASDAPAPTASDAPAASSAPATSVAIAARSEYRAALGDRSVVEALLALQNKVRASQPGARPLPAFRSLQPQKVPADPRAFRYARRSPGIYHPVLRSSQTPDRSS